MSIIEKYDCLVVPYAKHLSSDLIDKLYNLKEKGADVIFVDGLPKNTDKKFEVVALDNVANYFTEKGYVDISIENFHKIRHHHVVNGEVDAYMFFNESATETFEGVIKTGKTGNYNVYDFMTNRHFKGGEGDVYLRLEPYQSAIVAYEEDRGFESYVSISDMKEKAVDTEYEVSLFYYNEPEKLYGKFKTSTLDAVSASYPDFSGKIVYNFNMNVHPGKKTYLKIGEVGENARVTVNGKDCGILVSRPFVYDITDAVNEGENKVTVEVYTTLAHAIKDPVSMFVHMAKTGMRNLSLLIVE